MTENAETSASGSATTTTTAEKPSTAAPTTNVGEPDWLNGRIAQAKQSAQAEVLKALGVKSIDDAKAAVAAAAAKAEADKTAELRAAELKAKLDNEAAKAASQLAVITEYAGRQMAGLTAEQKAAVTAIAGDDPSAQLRAVAALQPTWASAAPTVATPPVATTTPPANTAPGHTAPSAAGAASPPNHRAAYQQAQKTNPFAAAEYGLRHEDEVYKPRT